MPLISVDHVSKRFPLPDGKGEFTVLDDVSLTVHAGEVVAREAAAAAARAPCCGSCRA